MSGYEVALAIREDPDLRGTTLIAFTGYASPSDVQRALDAGFDCHVAKPVHPAELQRILASVGRVQSPPPARPAESRAPRDLSLA